MSLTRSSAISSRPRRPPRRAALQRRTLVGPSGTTQTAGRSRGGGSVARLTVPGSQGWCCARTSRRFWLVGTLTPTNGSSPPRAPLDGDRRWVRERTPRSEPMGSSSTTSPMLLRLSGCRTGRSSGCSMSARRSLSAPSHRPWVLKPRRETRQDLPRDLPACLPNRWDLPFDLPRDLPFGLPLAL